MIAGFFNRILGFALRLILVRIIGDEGLGLFQMVFPIFITFSILTTMGLPVAVAKFVSSEVSQQRKKNALKILKISLVIVFISSLVSISIFLIKAEFIALNLLKDERTHLILLTIAPALLFVSLSSVLRGFFQGLRVMTPIAFSQVIEQLVRMGVTLALVYKLMSSTLRDQILGVSIGVSVGEGFGLLALILIFVYYFSSFGSGDSKDKTESTFSLIKKLFKFGIPITIGKLVASLMYTLEAITIPSILQRVGYTVSEATSLYGQLSGMVLQLIYLPTIITIALNSNLVPAISESLAVNNKRAIKKHSQEALRLTFYLGFLSSLILFLLPREICDLFFNYPEAGTILRTLSILAIFLYISQIFAAILQGLGKPNSVVRNSVIGLIIELGIIYSVVYLPAYLAFIVISLAIGIRYTVIAILNYLSINKEVKLALPITHIFIKPILAGLLVILILPQSYQISFHIFSSNLISLVISTSLSSLFYFAFLFISGGISIDDLKRIKP